MSVVGNNGVICIVRRAVCNSFVSCLDDNRIFFDRRRAYMIHTVISGSHCPIVGIAYASGNHVSQGEKSDSFFHCVLFFLYFFVSGVLVFWPPVFLSAFSVFVSVFFFDDGFDVEVALHVVDDLVELRHVIAFELGAPHFVVEHFASVAQQLV